MEIMEHFLGWLIGFILGTPLSLALIMWLDKTFNKKGK